MSITNNSNKLFILTLLTAAITACGGGGGSSSSATTPSTTGSSSSTGTNSSTGGSSTGSSTGSGSTSTGSTSGTGSTTTGSGTGSTTTPTNHSLYAVLGCSSSCSTGSTINAYTINSTTGAITATSSIAPFGASTNVGELDVTPDGKFAYQNVDNGTNNVIYQYSVGADGSLTALTTPTLTTNFVGNSGQIIFDHASKFAFVFGRTSSGANMINSYAISSTGGLSLVQTLSLSTWVTPVINPVTGVLYLNDGNNNIVEYNIGATGVLNQVATFTGTSIGQASIQAFTIDPTGKYLYMGYWSTPSSSSASAQSYIAEYTIGSDGSLTPMSTPIVNVTGSLGDLVIDGSGKYAYLANFDSSGNSSISQFTIGSNGVLAPMATPMVATNNSGSRISTVGNYVYVGDSHANITEYSIGATGALTSKVVVNVSSSANMNINALTTH